MSQFGFGFADHPVLKARAMPWEGCDRSGEHWRAYCEAFSANQMEGFGYSDYLNRVRKARGPLAVEMLAHNRSIVQRDLAGQIRDRRTIPDLLRVA